MTDLPTRLAERLQKLQNHLAVVLLIHLFAENLLNRLNAQRSPTPKRILEDNRTYSFAVKITLALHMGAIAKPLFENLSYLNSLRNVYAHELDANLAESFNRGFVERDGSLAFPDPEAVRVAIEAAPDVAGLATLSRIRGLTFGWLHDSCVALGVILD